MACTCIFKYADNQHCIWYNFEEPSHEILETCCSLMKHKY